jgi:DNA-binding transcriptional MerR regulator
MMGTRFVLDGAATVALELFQPRPDACYDLDATALLAGVTRRVVLVYVRAGLVRPVLQPPYGVMEFTEEAVYTVRRMERLRSAYGLERTSITTLLALLDELEFLRSALRVPLRVR